MDIARETDLVYYMGKGYGFARPYTEETDITAKVLAFARKVRALDNGSASNPAEA
jgi:cold shock CspA family protein